MGAKARNAIWRTLHDRHRDVLIDLFTGGRKPGQLRVKRLLLVEPVTDAMDRHRYPVRRRSVLGDPVDRPFRKVADLRVAKLVQPLDAEKEHFPRADAVAGGDRGVAARGADLEGDLFRDDEVCAVKTAGML